jgi:hypothetical protein
MGGGGGRESRLTLLGETAAHSPYESKREARGGCLGFLVYLFCGSGSRAGRGLVGQPGLSIYLAHLRAFKGPAGPL